MSVSEEGEESIPNSANGRLNKLQMLQYHQAILESQTRAWLQTQDGQDVCFILHHIFYTVSYFQYYKLTIMGFFFTGSNSKIAK